ncbi:hypothetical protein [[Flexibacter] sp. ATCC 35208]|uniref:hypothetical protein n=1 Tax=[Flexibacter] sp. ATCC 35208 TaxID=1936242 RepID=UPI00117EFE97|nr:hypothetical protein [[Flexibacter] sp. ATCC 35208]
MSKSLMIFFTILLGAFNGYSQRVYLKYALFLDINRQYIQIFNKQDSSVITDRSTDSSRLIKVFDMSEKGQLKFLLWDNSFKKKMEGEYLESSKLYTDTVFYRKAGRDGNGVRYRKFYRPLRNGDWKYYDEQGNIYLREKYSKGSLIETIISCDK